jgi:mRNA interferase MazF
MTVARGDVVLLDAPYITRPGSKLRPMLVIQNDRNNERMENTILATITTNLRRSDQPTQVLIDPETPEGKSSGLISRSVVSCENILTVRQSRILRKIGRLTDAQLALVDQAIKESLCLAQ